MFLNKDNVFSVVNHFSLSSLIVALLLVGFCFGFCVFFFFFLTSVDIKKTTKQGLGTEDLLPSVSC